ncbi:NUDIX domain-containing protein [Nocardioides sp. CPCC 205120]|uniref:NUDIX domain-containing protein n=1 Tax=Nocardioides sp. CPCC 205120 TaxID=3406462 RepID=UPI003B50471B
MTSAEPDPAPRSDQRPTADDPVGIGRFVVVPAAYVLLLRPGAGDVPEVLLQLRSGTGYMDDHWASGAAGHVEKGETAYDAARREAAEELGVSVVDLRVLATMQRRAPGPGPVAPIDERVDFFLTATSWAGEPRIMEGAKCADLRWFGLDALPDPVVPHELVALTELRRVVGPLGTVVAEPSPYLTFGFTTPPAEEEQP